MCTRHLPLDVDKIPWLPQNVEWPARGTLYARKYRNKVLNTDFIKYLIVQWMYLWTCSRQNSYTLKKSRKFIMSQNFSKLFTGKALHFRFVSFPWLHISWHDSFAKKIVKWVSKVWHTCKNGESNPSEWRHLLFPRHTSRSDIQTLVSNGTSRSVPVLVKVRATWRHHQTLGVLHLLRPLPLPTESRRRKTWQMTTSTPSLTSIANPAFPSSSQQRPRNQCRSQPPSHFGVSGHVLRRWQVRNYWSQFLDMCSFVGLERMRWMVGWKCRNFWFAVIN